MANAIDELAAFRKEIRQAYAGDDRIAHLDWLIDAKSERVDGRG